MMHSKLQETEDFSNEQKPSSSISSTAFELFFGSSSSNESLVSFKEPLHSSDHIASLSVKSSEDFDQFQSKTTFASAESIDHSTSFWRRFKF